MSWSHATPDEIDRGFDHFGGLRAAADAQLCELIQAADLSQTWMRDGARSLTEWVSLRLRIRPESARRMVRIAKRLVDLPHSSARLADGTLSLDQVDTISKVATPATEVALFNEALGLSNSQLDRLARRAAPATAAHERSVWERRWAVLQWNLDESELKLKANLSASGGQIVQDAIESAADRIPANPETGVFDPYPQRMADGLVELCATTGDQTGVPPQITLNADLESLTTETDGVAELASGSLVPNETARRLSCDSAVETIISHGNRIVGVGRRSRTVPGWLRRLVNQRDHNHCQFPGCPNKRWLQAHHIKHWAQGGRTDLANLILLCGFHHRFLHEHGWHITRDHESRFQFRKPDWTRYPASKPDPHPRILELVGRRRPI